SGLALNSGTGYVTGTPTAAVSKYAWVRVTDEHGLSGKVHIHIIINAGSGSTVSISITPTSASVASGGTQQFSARVGGASNTGVQWSTSSGSISDGGKFTAPNVNSATNVTIRATSAADPTKVASALVTVDPATTTVSVSVSPSSASVTAGKSQQFAASVQGTTNTSVSWSASAGSISSVGMFTAPSEIGRASC